ncbi:MAG: MFS transporter [Bacteroidota bacterium]|nr:MFS transporter [Bacteroidota bacterium]MDP3145795.1 MFS transporter [Bacteroidota bacterium]MDP3558429.1 MFS transporter [Bacteroidota bacterium]
MDQKASGAVLNKLIIVAALGYFVDIYDLLLFGVERTASLNDILPIQFPGISDTVLKMLNASYGKLLLNWQMAGMLIGGIFWGILGDKKGRLSVLFGSILVYSIANILNGMIESTNAYIVLRFVSGFGLAGELGAGITLVSESMSKEKRGYGTMIVATVGVFGAVVAGFMGEVIENWRNSFYLGGAMGLALLFLRIGVFESGMFASIKTETTIKKGNILQLFSNKKSLLKYVCIIFVTVPVWYVMGTLVLFSPELSELMGLPEKSISAGKAIMFAYAGITVGDIASGLISQLLKSRKKALALFLSLTVIGTILYFLFGGTSVAVFYAIVAFIGFATGYWAVFISTAAELFGTNIRSTATTTAPNFVRASTILISILLNLIISVCDVDKLLATKITGAIIISLGFVALYFLEETFGKDLNYTE